MGLLTPCSVLRGGFLCTVVVQGGGFLLPSSRVPGGMVLDEMDTYIRKKPTCSEKTEDQEKNLHNERQ